MPKRKTTKQYILDCVKKHGDKYIYTKVNYTLNCEKVCIICKVHGEFWKIASDHLSGGGCKKCMLESRSMSNTEFKDKVNKLHYNKYDLTLTYFINYNTDVTYTCNIHGNITRPARYLLAGMGCRLCALTKIGWNKSNWKNAVGKTNPKLYFIMFSNKKENFFKIGITKNYIRRRFAYNKDYILKVLYLKYGESDEIWNLERDLKHKFKYIKYKPKIKFEGYTECFSEYKPILKYLNKI